MINKRIAYPLNCVLSVLEAKALGFSIDTGYIPWRGYRNVGADADVPNLIQEEEIINVYTEYEIMLMVDKAIQERVQNEIMGDDNVDDEIS